MTAAVAPQREGLLRIGEVAELTGTTPRTIRYYEEIGLLPEASDRVSGKRRLYTQADVERLGEMIRLRDLLGLSLDDLKRLVEAETARAGLRERWQQTDDPAEQRQILEQSLVHIADQLKLVRARKAELERLEGELSARQRRVRGLLREKA
ncbi:MAG: MerR family transcriptional regulator, repressor of the yfmOP operon [Thermoleophilaceae bacterium]|jgi:DNA-binding transcriptional MerR regulator|nr:MerR family transcriptional regulator, repressor of the yfmOP operon [Thermoleophilaceae bacterium]